MKTLIHGYSRPLGTNRKENKKKTSDDKVGPIYCSFLEEYCGGILGVWEKSNYSHVIMVCVIRQSVNHPLCSKPSADHGITTLIRA